MLNMCLWCKLTVNVSDLSQVCPNWVQSCLSLWCTLAVFPLKALSRPPETQQVTCLPSLRVKHSGSSRTQVCGVGTVTHCTFIQAKLNKLSGQLTKTIPILVCFCRDAFCTSQQPPAQQDLSFRPALPVIQLQPTGDVERRLSDWWGFVLFFSINNRQQLSILYIHQRDKTSLKGFCSPIRAH